MDFSKVVGINITLTDSIDLVKVDCINVDLYPGVSTYVCEEGIFTQITHQSR